MTAAQEGRLVGRTHHFPVRVYFADTDAAGMVYHATYLDFAERARTEMMRLLGFDHLDLRNRLGLQLAVRSCELDFVRAAHIDDLLEVRSTLLELAGASMRLSQDVWRAGEEIARIAIRLVCIRIDGKPARLPDELRDAIQDFLSAEAI